MTLKRSQPHNTKEPIHLLFVGAGGCSSTWSPQARLCQERDLGKNNLFTLQCTKCCSIQFTHLSWWPTALPLCPELHDLFVPLLSHVPTVPPCQKFQALVHLYNPTPTAQSGFTAVMCSSYRYQPMHNNGSEDQYQLILPPLGNRPLEAHRSISVHLSESCPITLPGDEGSLACRPASALHEKQDTAGLGQGKASPPTAPPLLPTSAHAQLVLSHLRCKPSDLNNTQPSAAPASPASVLNQTPALLATALLARQILCF